MGLDTDDLDKAARDVWTERRISYSIYCGQCGYNLRTLRYIGRCPECGNEYNARPAVRQGVHVPGEVRFPSVELVCVLFFLGSALAFGTLGIRPLVPWMVTFGFLSLVVGVISACLFYQQLGRYLRFLWVERHLEDDD